jgi:chromosome partitioning protein
MPTIVMISPKGGAGKTTSALILSCELARATSVTLVDADPNRPMAEWAKSGHSPPNLRIVSDGDERNIISKIRRQRPKRRSLWSTLKAPPPKSCSWQRAKPI